MLHPSNARSSAFPALFYQESPIYPSFRHQSSFFREGVATPASAPNASYNACYRPQQHGYTMTGLHGNNRNNRAANIPNAYDPSGHALYNQGCHMMPNANQAQLMLPPQQQRIDDRFPTAAGNRRALTRPQPERSMNSPSLWPSASACTRYNQKSVATLCGKNTSVKRLTGWLFVAEFVGRPREGMRYCPINGDV